MSHEIADHFSHSERELLIQLCEKRDEVAASFFPEYGSARERSRLEDALEHLLELIGYDPRELIKVQDYQPVAPDTPTQKPRGRSM